MQSTGAVTANAPESMRVTAETVNSASTASEPGFTTETLMMPLGAATLSAETTTAPETFGVKVAEGSGSASPQVIAATMVTRVLGMLGLGYFASTLPGAPGESPLLLAMLGWARKESEKLTEEDQTTALRLATTTGQTVDEDMAAQLAMTSSAVENTAPVIEEVAVGAPDPQSGVVAGAVIATDGEGDGLTYALAGNQPAGGTVDVDSNGAFTFTPNQAARLAAAQTSGADYAEFTVAVTDGEMTTTTTVSAAVLPMTYAVSATAGTTGNYPTSVVMVGNRAYVANASGSSVSVIDMSTSTPTLVKTIAVGSRPIAVVASPDGTKVYVSNSWSNTVSVISTATNTVTATISVGGSAPTGMAISGDGSRLYVANTNSNTVSVINTATRAVVTRVTVGSQPYGIAISPDGTRVYVTNRNANSVSVISTSGTPTVVETINVGSYPTSVTASNSHVVVGNQYGNSVSVINMTQANRPVTTIAMGSGSAPTSVLLSKDGTLAYVAKSNDTVSVIDMTAATPLVVRTIQVDPAAEAGAQYLAFDSTQSRLLVADTTDRALRSVSLVRGNTAPVAGIPSVIEVNPVTGAVTGALNFTDPDGDALSYTVTQPSPGTGTVSINGQAGTYTFVPTQAARDLAAQGGPDSVTFTVTATDGTATAGVPVTAAITPSGPVPNRPPVAGTPSTTSQDIATGTVSGSLNFSDPDGDGLTYDVPDQPATGTVTVDSSGVYTFTPTQAARDAAAQSPGTDSTSITLTATDGEYTTSVTFNVPILPTPGANEAPVIGDVSTVAPDPDTGAITGVVNATDPDGDSLTYSLVGPQPASGSVYLGPDGTFTFTPTTSARLTAAQSPGTDYAMFTVAVTDGEETITTTVTVAVLPGNIGMSSSSATTGTTPMGLVVVGDKAYVANQGSGTVSVIDTTTGTLIKTITVGNRPTGVVASPDATKVYVTNGWSNTVSVIDTSTNTVTATISVGSGPVAAAISADGSRLYVVNASGNNVSVVDTATRKVITTIGVGAFPYGAALDGTRLYVNNRNANTVSVIDTTTSTVISTIPVGGYPSSVAVNGTRALVTNQSSNSVSVIDTASSQVLSTVQLGNGTAPTSVIFSKDGTVAYIANSNDTISVLDMTSATPAVVRTVQVDSAPESGAHTLALSPDGTRVFVTDASDKTLRSLSLTADAGVTVGTSTLVIPGGNGYAVSAKWYFPNKSEPPVGVIYLQHGSTRTNSNLSALAYELADRTNSIVVTPNISSNYYDPYYIYNAPIEQAVADMFQGERAELTASASAAAGQQITLPQQFVLAGHSAGGNLVAAAAGYLADDGATSNLKAVILFDSVDDGDGVAGMAKLDGLTVPVMLIAAPPCNCNNWGGHTTTVVNGAPDQFIGVMIQGGTHLDAEGASTDATGVQFCSPAPSAENAAAVQTITAAWINDAFTGSESGIYGPEGAVVPVDGASVQVIAVGNEPID
ncbi:beta-propeller fold lactonase family protein [Mycobacterium sp. B14F4]|uniref:YVTN family beta-propeller repeat protein n=1 Tax=Mycobacterium sp. B14F4 TaxID=3153565 RepID=UPI00325EDF97